MNPETLANAPANYLLGFMLITTITAFARNWVYLRREVIQRDRRIEELAAEKKEYKTMALKAVGLGEALVDVAKERSP